MRYSDSIEQAGEYLRIALKHMSENSLPANPVNYTVWYEYAAGMNEKLNEAIDHFFQHAQQITPQMNKEFYNNYIEGSKKILVESIREQIQGILLAILSHITETGEDLSRSGKSLKNYTNQLLEISDTEGIRNVTNKIIAESKTMKQSGDRLGDRLDATKQEVEILRKELKKSKKEAKTDALTGLANRRGFDEKIDQEIEQTEETGKNLCLLLSDIDHFKEINDKFGHLVGDNVLKMIATTINDLTKGRDFVARFGGEEFAVILPDTPLGGALSLAEQIRSHLEAVNWREKRTQQQIGAIKLSFGVALHRLGEPIDALIQRADKALYQSKSDGRNRVTSENDIGQ